MKYNYRNTTFLSYTIIVMKILVLGFGPHSSGLDAAEYYISKGAEVTIYESAEREVSDFALSKARSLGASIRFGELGAKEIRTYDTVVKTPSIPMSFQMLKSSRYVTNDLAALLQDERVKRMKKIVITGSKGKTSIASAVTHALNILGESAIMCGSLGLSGFNILQDLNEKGCEAYTHIVLEMTNWQISDTDYALSSLWPEIDLALLTRKANEKRAEKKETYYIFGPWIDKAIIDKNARDTFLKAIGRRKPRKIIFTPTRFNPNRNIEPLESAYEILKALGYHKRDIENALSTYKGIPNRIEQVAFKDSILYINDSAATIPEAVAFTVKMIAGASIHLITGGSDKSGDLDLSSMKLPIKMASSITLLKGSFTTRLIEYLKKNNIGYSGPYDNIFDAVENAKAKAVENLSMGSNSQIVLLAPASSSQETFNNEFDLGKMFKDAVFKIIGK